MNLFAKMDISGLVHRAEISKPFKHLASTTCWGYLQAKGTNNWVLYPPTHVSWTPLQKRQWRRLVLRRVCSGDPGLFWKIVSGLLIFSHFLTVLRANISHVRMNGCRIASVTWVSMSSILAECRVFNGIARVKGQRDAMNRTWKTIRWKNMTSSRLKCIMYIQYLYSLTCE